MKIKMMIPTTKEKNIVLKSILEVRTPRKMTVSEWAVKNRVLSSETSAEAGAWNIDRAKYQQGIMDSILEKGVEKIIVMASSQVGKTEIENNTLGYYIEQEPCPILVIHPTVELAKAWSKERLVNMIRDTKSLSRVISPSVSRTSGNTILNKNFPKGYLAITGANAPSALASRPIRVVLLDEIDRYPISAGVEGDPVNLAIVRTKTFPKRKILMVSTPTVKHQSRIEYAFHQSDMRYYYVPCKHCNHMQVLNFREGIKFQRDENKNLIEKSVMYACRECGGLHAESDKPKMVKNGKWIATQEPKEKKSIGFHINELYSPWSTWANVVQNFLTAKGDFEQLKVWTNTALGESWEQAGDRVAYEKLYNRRELYKKGKTIWVPEGVYYLTCGVDVQQDRLEMEVVGWGYNYESWGIDYKVILQDPNKQECWNQLDEYLNQIFNGVKNRTFKIYRTFIDSGGANTEAVYAYASRRATRGIFAIKGQGGEGHAIFKRANTVKRYKKGSPTTLFMLGVDNAKSAIYSYLNTDTLGDGYCHFPLHYDKEYFKMLTSEEYITYQKMGRFAYKWKSIYNRNEALDCRVYALSAMVSLNPNWDKIKINKWKHEK